MGTRDLLAAAPWWAKVAGKLVIARLPISGETWQRLGLFRHGAMDDGGYAQGVFTSHWKACGRPELQGATVLELGPGDSIATAVVAAAHGARAVLVDAGRYASPRIDVYAELAARLAADGLTPPDLSGVDSLDGVLRACQAQYLTDGLASLRTIPTGTIDVVLSQAVLEHVRRHEFEATMRELARALRPEGVASHRVDLRDHLGGGLDNLRFGSRLWESDVFVSSGFYTNRLTYREMLATFRQVHRGVETSVPERWEQPPIARSRLAREFRHLDDEDLLVPGFHVVLRDPLPSTRERTSAEG